MSEATPSEYWAAQDEFGSWHVFKDGPMDAVARLANDLDEAGRDELVGLLNKGLCFGGMLQALYEATTNGEWSEGEQCGDWCIGKAVYEMLRDAIAKAEGRG